MDSRQLLEHLVEPLRNDRTSGSVVLGRKAAEVLRRAAARVPAGSPEEFRWALGQAVLMVLEAQPAMATLVRLAVDVLDAVEAATDLEEARHRALHAAGAFQAGLAARSADAAQRASALLPEGGRVITCSSSSTVQAALLSAAERRARLSVVCLESRPMNEGRALAQTLSRAGLDVVYAVDAAAAVLTAESDAVLLGADSVGDAGVVNKIGSSSLALAARHAGIPVLVVADSTKILPRRFPQDTRDDRPPGEVWDAPPGVEVWNRYFEASPIAWVSALVTEDATLAPAAVETLRGAMAVPPALQTWLRERA